MWPGGAWLFRFQDASVIIVAMANPLDVNVVDELQRIMKARIRPVLQRRAYFGAYQAGYLRRLLRLWLWLWKQTMAFRPMGAMVSEGPRSADLEQAVDFDS